MTFQSLLYNKPVIETENKMPSFFSDLHLDQIINEIVAGKEKHNLLPFFYTPLHNKDEILYRQNIFRDIESNPVYEHLRLFSQNIDEMLKILSTAEKCSYKYQQERFHLDAVVLYGNTIELLAHHLSVDPISSTGLISFREYLDHYRQSVKFIFLKEQANKLLSALSAVQYDVLLDGLRTHVLPYQQQADYSMEITELFDRFRQGATKDYRVDYPFVPEMNRIEANILDGVASLYPDLFEQLDHFFTSQLHFEDQLIMTFYHEVQFYLSYLAYINPLKQSGLTFSYPEITIDDKNICCYNGFDLALAFSLLQVKAQVICNDFYLNGKERIIIITGPNQGGKTTFARMFGQLHYLMSIGCPVPGVEVKLFLYDQLFTHFEQEESINKHHSKFEDDLFRIHDILAAATEKSIIILNETLSSTALKDAMVLSKKILEHINRLDAFCIWVTFIDELSVFSEKAVSMVSEVEADTPAVRTFKIIRKPSDGLAYALSIAEKYRVTYKHIKQRITF